MGVKVRYNHSTYMVDKNGYYIDNEWNYRGISGEVLLSISHYMRGYNRYIPYIDADDMLYIVDLYNSKIIATHIELSKEEDISIGDFIVLTERYSYKIYTLNGELVMTGSKCNISNKGHIVSTQIMYQCKDFREQYHIVNFLDDMVCIFRGKDNMRKVYLFTPTGKLIYSFSSYIALTPIYERYLYNMDFHNKEITLYSPFGEFLGDFIVEDPYDFSIDPNEKPLGVY